MSVIASVRAFIQDYPGLSTFDDLVGGTSSGRYKKLCD